MFLAQKEQQIKMSSVMLFTINAVGLCIVIVNEKPWTRAKEACMGLELLKKRMQQLHCSMMI